MCTGNICVCGLVWHNAAHLRWCGHMQQAANLTLSLLEPTCRSGFLFQTTPWLTSMGPPSQGSTTLPSRSPEGPSTATTTTDHQNGTSFYSAAIFVYHSHKKSHAWFFPCRYQSLNLEYKPSPTVSVYQFHWLVRHLKVLQLTFMFMHL